MSENENGTGSGSRTFRCFAGSNTPLLTGALVGEPILVSYADIRSRRTWWNTTLRPLLEARAFSFVILDSGAFTVQSSGISIDVEAYAAFAAENLELFDVVVNLDSIAGDLEESRRNLATLRAAGVPAIPVFHEGEPFEELEKILAESDFVGLGFARVGPRLKNKSPARLSWLEETFEKIGDRAKVHGFAMTRLADDFPFFSVDSTTWISEHRAARDRFPGEKVEKTHGVGGELAERLECWTDEEVVSFVVGSYAAPSGWKTAAAEIERDSKGQARTVFRRYGNRLEDALRATEAGRLAEAA